MVQLVYTVCLYKEEVEEVWRSKAFMSSFPSIYKKMEKNIKDIYNKKKQKQKFKAN